jgi:hypothetical protein
MVQPARARLQTITAKIQKAFQAALRVSSMWWNP